jgi:hypothetical protein
MKSGYAMTSKVVAVLNIGGKHFGGKCAASIEAAAKRWGARLDVITVDLPDLKGVHPWWQKLAVHRRYADDTQVVQMDGDMMVRADCPWPGDYVEPTWFGFCSTVHPDTAPFNGPDCKNNLRLRDHSGWCRRWGVNPWRTLLNGYPNAGLLVYTVGPSRRLLEYALLLGEKEGWDATPCPEQSALSVAMWRLKWERVQLPNTFNHTGVPMGVGPKMQKWIYHFHTGSTTQKDKRANEYDWTLTE